MPLVALVHATPNSLPPIWEAMQRLYPEARTLNFLDEGLLTVVERETGLTPAFARRFVHLMESVEECAPDAALLTCTVATPVVDDVRPLFRTPMIKADEAMLSEALRMGRRIGLLCTYGPTLVSSEGELRRLAALQGREVQVTAELAPGAFTALREGRGAEHDGQVEQAAKRLARQVDVLVLAQMSMARVAPRLQHLAVPVLTSPDAAVRAVKALLMVH